MVSNRHSSAGKINNSTAIAALSQILKDNGYHTIHCGKDIFLTEALTLGAIDEMKNKIQIIGLALPEYMGRKPK